MGRGTKIKTGIFLAVTVSLYLIQVIFGALAAGGGAPKLFPTPIGNVSDIFKLYVTPVGATFSIWGLIYVLQFIWMIYAMVSMCRGGTATNLLSGKFYLAFIVSTAFVIGWLIAFTRQQVIPSFLVIVLHQIFIETAFGYACVDLREYLQTRDVDDENKLDVWCHRILVQNGILFYLTWTNVASLVNAAIALNHELEVSDETSSLVILIILAVMVIVWFYVENFAIQSYTEYTFTSYIVVIWALSGVTAGVWGVNDTIAGVALALLVVTIILFIARIVLICVRCRKRESYETISYNTESQTVKT